MNKPAYIRDNLVLIQPTAHLNKIGEWVIFDIHDPAHHYTVKGTVLMVPDKLYFAGHQLKELGQFAPCSQIVKQKQFLSNRSVEFDTPMELEVGDEVVFKYINHVSCVEDGRYWTFGDEKNPALFIPYDTIFMAERAEKKVMLNGWLWVEPMAYEKDELTDAHGVVKNRMGGKKIGRGTIRSLGTPNKGYLYGEVPDCDDVAVGDQVLFKKTAGVSIEWFYHQSLNEGKHPYYVMQRKDIMAVEGK
jgi:co-chaperonin GroES (HSP10)